MRFYPKHCHYRYYCIIPYPPITLRYNYRLHNNIDIAATRARTSYYKGGKFNTTFPSRLCRYVGVYISMSVQLCIPSICSSVQVFFHFAIRKRHRSRV